VLVLLLFRFIRLLSSGHEALAVENAGRVEDWRRHSVGSA
jgi:hypothetical protein